MFGILSNMMKMSVREAQHHFGAVLDRVLTGEPVEITRRRQVVARIVPAHRASPRVKWPDIMARLGGDFPEGVPPGKPASEILYEARGED